MFDRDQAESIFTKLHISPLFATNTVFGWVYLDGKRELLLRYSNGNFHMSNRFVEALRNELRLEPDEFARLCECTLSGDDYLTILRGRL